jgi:outer membrane protein TolC
VALPITAGMLTTVAVLVPVIFTTGYTGRTMRPLNITIVSTLVAALVVSLTVIPILAARFFSGPDNSSGPVRFLLSPVDKGVELLTRGYEGLVTLALRFRIITALIFLVFMVFSLRVVKPLLGGEQMPPMDTGIVIIQFDTAASAKPAAVNQTLTRIEAIIQQYPAVVSLSSVIGSEPGVISFGGGGATAQSGKMTVYLTPRTQRTETIWEIEAKWRKALATLSGVRTFRIAEYGATPVATTKAPFNAILSGPDPLVLSHLADRVMDLLHGSPGLIDLGRSWYLDKTEQKITVDPGLAAFYGTSPLEVAGALRMAVQGVSSTAMRLDGFSDIPVRVRFQADQVDDINRLEEIPISTRSGQVKLANLARVSPFQTQGVITRENQRNTIDITAGNSGLTIAQANGAAKKRLAGLSLPKGYSLHLAGTARDMGETQTSLGHALVVGLALLFILLMAMFKSLAHPVTIILSIPLAAAGGVWGLLLFDKPFCMPALMGFILLGGTIVNNAILMLDFIIKAREKGLEKNEAIVQSVRLRLRPILITAVSTMVGFSPLIFETAVGLERMSPLGIAAASGLLVGTIVTMIAVPVIYSLLDSLKKWLVHIWIGKTGIPGTSVALMLIVMTAFLVVAPGRVGAETKLCSPLTLNQAVQVALEHNPDLATARAENALAGGAIMAAASARGLHLDLTGQGEWSGKRHIQVAGLSSTEQGFAHLRYQGVLSATWLVMDFGKTAARIRSALNLHKAGVSLKQRREQEIVFAVSMQFIEAMTFTDLLAATAGTRDSLQAFARSIRLQIKQGRAPEVDALKIDIRIAEVESTMAELDRSLEISRAALARLMGLEEVLPPLSPGAVSEAVIDDVEETKAPTVRARLDIRARELMVEAGKKGVLASKRRFLPRIELFATGGLYGADNPETATGEVDDDPWKNDYSGGIRITVPLLDNHLRRSAVAMSWAKLEKTRAALRAVRLAAIQEITVARANVKSARVKILATRKTVVHARKVVQIEQLKYRIGRGTSAEVLDAETALLNAESLSRKAARELAVSRLEERLALGGQGGLIPVGG